MVMRRCGGAESLQGTNRRHRWEDDGYEPSPAHAVHCAGGDAPMLHRDVSARGE